MSIDSRTNMPSDVISTLVSIYNSKNLFVNLDFRCFWRRDCCRLWKRIQIALSVRYSLVIYLWYFPFDDLPSAEEELWNSEDSIRRGCSPSVWSDVKGYNRFPANWWACGIVKSGMPCPRPLFSLRLPNEIKLFSLSSIPPSYPDTPGLLSSRAI